MGRGRLSGQQGMARTIAAAVPTPPPATAPAPQQAATPYQQALTAARRDDGSVDITQLSGLSDGQLDHVLNSIKSHTTVDLPQQGVTKQQITDTQRFFNAIGWTSRTTDLITGDKAFLTAARAANAEILYHTDDAAEAHVPNAKVLADQFMSRKERQYLSGGYYGDGTYFANRATGWGGSWSYGESTGSTQFRSFLNRKAKVISDSALDRQFRAWSASHPKAYRNLVGFSQGYHLNGGSTDGSKSIFAAMCGYNVISSGDGYYTVLDRSAVTTQKKVLTRVSALNPKDPTW